MMQSYGSIAAVPVSATGSKLSVTTFLEKCRVFFKVFFFGGGEVM